MKGRNPGGAQKAVVMVVFRRIAGGLNNYARGGLSEMTR